MKNAAKAALNNNTVSNEQRVVGAGVAAAAAGSNQGRGANLVYLSVASVQYPAVMFYSSTIGP